MCRDIRVCAAPGRDQTVAEGDDNMPKSKRKESSSRTSSTDTDLQLYASAAPCKNTVTTVGTD